MTAILDSTRSLLPSGGLPQALASSNARALLILAIGLQVALAVPSLAALFLDDRLLNGVSVWSKPLKFQASLIMMLGTLLLLLPLIETHARHGLGVWLACLAASLMASGEILYITLQAARGRASHFNSDTAIETFAYGLMGIGAVLLVLSSLAIGLYILLKPEPGVARGLQLGGGWGLVLGSVLTLITALALGSGRIAGPGHWIGGVHSDAGGLFLFGWSRTGGDLRVPHFFATHLMQALPLLGLLIDRVAPSLAVVGIAAGALAGIAIVAATFLQAVSGVPFL